MGRFGLLYAALVALFIVVTASQSDSSNATTTSAPSTGPQNITIATPDATTNDLTKDGLGQGRSHRRNGYGGQGNHYQNNNYNNNQYEHKGGYRHKQRDSGEYDFHTYKVKPYFDTHYCSVHGSFRLAYHEKAEGKEYGGGQDNYQQGGGYGNQGGNYGGQDNYQQGGGYGNQGESYGSQGGYKQGSGYGRHGGKHGGYGKNSYKDEPRYVRKITRQYCRYAAAWSAKACKFCCKVVARSAYTNPDDIVAAIFSFDPADPASGGAGVEGYGKKDNYDQSPAYGGDNNYGGQQEGYDQGNSYGGSQGGYGGQDNYNQGSGYGNYNQGSSQNQAGYSSASYGNGPYRAKRNAEPSDYSVPPAQPYDQQQYQGSPAEYSETSNAYSQKPDHGNKYEAENYNSKAIHQCVCCAPKHRYYK